VSHSSRSQQIEFGDFQTPIELASRCCLLVRDQHVSADTIVEPTCGEGSFIAAAVKILHPKRVMAYEIDSRHVQTARRRMESIGFGKCQVKRQDFFTLDWKAEREKLGQSVLFLGNPPWVTNSKLGTIAASRSGKNSPRKLNVEGLRGIEAMTGRSNFDISESVMQTLLAAMRPDQDSLAMLVKNATARKVLRRAWNKGVQFSHASMHAIDAKQSFGVTVDACFLVLRAAKKARSIQVCYRSPSLEVPASEVALGWADGRLVADPSEAKATGHLQGTGTESWRSGVKHDLASVLELVERDGSLFTRAGGWVDIETDRVYPLAKGADVANLRTSCPERRLLIPQRTISESTAALSAHLPKTFRYLQSRQTAFDARKSSIYRNRDRFAVFGLGPYTFAPWKVAICGLYKRLAFAVYGPVRGRAVVFDDTTYSLSFQCEPQARHVERLLESETACRFFQARVFWDSKRPITAELLRGLDLESVALENGCAAEYRRLFGCSGADTSPKR
jgi:hypothetical protein